MCDSSTQSKRVLEVSNNAEAVSKEGAFTSALREEYFEDIIKLSCRPEVLLG